MTLSFSEFNSTNKVDLLKQQLSLEEDSNLANFNPPEKPAIQTKNDKPVENNKEIEIDNQSYYNQYLPQTTPKDNNYVNLEMVNDKLDYLINLFEEQKEFRTDNILEELILYIFFGIFLIYVIDSFTKVKGYSR